MAPQKRRATTLQEKFGFVDEDLNTPQHDAMMMWLDGQAEGLVREYFNVPSSWPEERIAHLRSEADEYVRSHHGQGAVAGLGAVPARSLIIQKKIWEKPIVTPNGYAVGFADMEVIARRPSKLGVLHHVRLGADAGKPPLADWSVDEVHEHVIFEVKTTIRSVGELIRQVRLYQEYLQGHYVVVSPDDRFAVVLRDQGIQFVKYEDQD